MAQTQYSAFVERASNCSYSVSTCVLEHRGRLYGMGDGGNFNQAAVYRSDDLGTNWTYIGNWPFAGRQGDKWVSYQGQIHVFGGWRGYAMRDHWKSPDGVTWTQVTSDMGWGGFGFGSAIYDDGTGEKIWVFQECCTWTFDGVSWMQVSMTCPVTATTSAKLAVSDAGMYLSVPGQPVFVWSGGQWVFTLCAATAQYIQVGESEIDSAYFTTRHTLRERYKMRRHNILIRGRVMEVDVYGNR